MVKAKHRLCVDCELSPGSKVPLGAESAHYVSRVLRLKTGDELICFNGDGYSYLSTIMETGRRETIVSIESVLEFQTETIRIHLVQSLIKRMDTLLQKTTELGVTDIWLMQSERSEVHVSDTRLQQKFRHWRAVMQSACEQSGRNRIPRLNPPLRYAELLNQLPCSHGYILDPGGAPFSPDAQPTDTVIMVGPEGGWTDVELQKAQASGLRTSCLGTNTLRADTAPLTALAIVQHTWAWRYA